MAGEIDKDNDGDATIKKKMSTIYFLEAKTKSIHPSIHPSIQGYADEGWFIF